MSDGRFPLITQQTDMDPRTEPVALYLKPNLQNIPTCFIPALTSSHSGKVYLMLLN